MEEALVLCHFKLQHIQWHRQVPAKPAVCRRLQMYQILKVVVGYFLLDSIPLTEGSILDPCYVICEQLS